VHHQEARRRSIAAMNRVMPIDGVAALISPAIGRTCAPIAVERWPPGWRNLRKNSPRKQVSRDRRKRNAKNPSVRKAVAKAPAPAPVNQMTAPSYKVHDIAIDSIRVPDTLNKVNPENVERLVESIGMIGLRTPITIRPLESGPQLAVGLDRLEAAKILGWKTIPCVEIRGGPTIARLWVIAENLHRATLSALEDAELTAEWVELTEALQPISAQQKGPGRPESGKAKAARELPVKGKTEQARRKNIERKLKIAAIDPAVKDAVREAGLDDNPSKLLKISAETTPEAQLAKVHEPKAGSPKPDPGPSADSTGTVQPAFEVLKREWKRAKKLRRAWERASPSDRTRFVKKVLKYTLKED
jgi:ParB-like chromosome segregation protein Spo0J